MMQFDLIVIGAGPGGYVTAIRGAQLGLNTAIIEQDPSGLGGTCLRRGCVPTKTWLETSHRFGHMSSLAEFGIAGVEISQMRADLAAIVKRKDKIVLKNGKGIEFLMKKNKVSIIKGKGKLLGSGKVEVSNGNETVIYEAKKIVLATGSVPRGIQGLETDGIRVLNSDHMLDIKELPSHLVILGAGAIGVEFASVFARLGSKVTLVELMGTVLPIEDVAIGDELSKMLTKLNKIDVRVKTKITSIARFEDHVVCNLEGEKPGIIECSHVLIAVGREPIIMNIGLQEAGVEIERHSVVVDEFMRSSDPNIYAIGDITKTPMLAHVASEEGIVAAEHAAKELGKEAKPHPVDYSRIPSCTYCEPEVGCIGLTEAKAREQYDVIVGKFPFMPLAKANIIGEPHGFVKIVADKNSDRILGIHIIGPKATELISSSVALLGGNYTVGQLINTMYPHPTLNEIFPEAGRSVYNMAISM